MSEQTVVIGGVNEVRSGETNGHKWTIWKVTDGNGEDLGSCLGDAADSAKGLIGQRAVVVNETETKTKDGKTYTNLKFKSALPAPEPAASAGEVDWDAKDLKAHIRACYAIASASFPLGAPWEIVQERAEKILARVYDPSSPDKPKSPFIPPGTVLPTDPPADLDDVPF